MFVCQYLRSRVFLALAVRLGLCETVPEGTLRIGGKISMKVVRRYGGLMVHRVEMTGMITEYMCVFVCMCVRVCVGSWCCAVGTYGWWGLKAEDGPNGLVKVLHNLCDGVYVSRK